MGFFEPIMITTITIIIIMIIPQAPWNVEAARSEIATEVSLY